MSQETNCHVEGCEKCQWYVAYGPHPTIVDEDLMICSLGRVEAEYKVKQLGLYARECQKKNVSQSVLAAASDQKYLEQKMRYKKVGN